MIRKPWRRWEIAIACVGGVLVSTADETAPLARSASLCEAPVSSMHSPMSLSADKASSVPAAGVSLAAWPVNEVELMTARHAVGWLTGALIVGSENVSLGRRFQGCGSGTHRPILVW